MYFYQIVWLPNCVVTKLCGYHPCFSLSLADRLGLTTSVFFALFFGGGGELDLFCFTTSGFLDFFALFFGGGGELDLFKDCFGLGFFGDFGEDRLGEDRDFDEDRDFGDCRLDEDRDRDFEDRDFDEDRKGKTSTSDFFKDCFGLDRLGVTDCLGKDELVVEGEKSFTGIFTEFVFINSGSGGRKNSS